MKKKITRPSKAKKKISILVPSDSCSASGKRSKNAVPKSTPAAKEARKCEILRANFTRDKRRIPPMRDPTLPNNEKTKIYSNVDMIDKFQRTQANDLLL